MTEFPKTNDLSPPVQQPQVMCIICHCAIESSEPATPCPGCGAAYHAECWSYNGGCGVYGCSQAATTEGLSSLEIPPSHWGREDKDCPHCGSTILAAAKRCKHCGAMFSSAAPQGSAAYREQRRVETSLPTLRKWAIVFLVFGLIPFTAPAAAVSGAIWLLANRRAIRALPPIIGAIGKIGVSVAWVQTLLMIAIAFLNSTING